MKVQSFDLNLVPGGVPVHVHADQRDTERVFAATMWDGDEPYVFDGTETITIQGTSADGHEFSHSDIATASGSVVTFSLAEDMSNAPGKAVANIVLSKGTIRIGSENFILNIQRSSAPNATIFTEVE